MDLEVLKRSAYGGFKRVYHTFLTLGTILLILSILYLLVMIL